LYGKTQSTQTTQNRDIRHLKDVLEAP